MKRSLSIIGAVICMFLSPITSSSAFAFRSIAIGDKAPDFTLPSVKGGEVSLNSYEGKIIVLLFWATDSESKEQRSVELLRTLESIYREYEKRDVVALSVNFDEGGQEKVTRILEDTDITFPVLLDEEREVYGSYGVFILPAVGIIGKDGTLKKAIGYTHDIEKMIDGEVQVLLGLKTEEELAGELVPEEVVEKSEELKGAERHLNLGRKMVERRLLDQARKEFEEAARLDPEHADAPIELGLVLITIGEYDEALAQLTRGLELDPESAKAHSGLGLVYFHKSDFEMAIDELEWALEINPRDAKTFYRLGIVYEKSGNQEKALEQYKRALKLIFKGK